MRQPEISPDWHSDWRSSYKYDLMELYGDRRDPGYANAYAIRRDHTVGLVSQVLQPPATILDIGAAQGNFSLALAELGYKVTWNDFRGHLFDYVRQKDENDSLIYAPGNAFDLEFPALFNCVLITEIIEHVAHPDEFLRKTASLVRPGGYIIMTTPNGGYFRNKLPRFSNFPDPSVFESVQFKPDGDGHIFLLYEDEIRQFVASSGLHLDRLDFFTNTLTNGHMKTNRLLHMLPRGVVDGLEKASQSLPLGWRRKLSVHLAARFRKHG